MPITKKPKKRSGRTVIVSVSLAKEDKRRLDVLAGPRGRSEYVRNCIEADWLAREQVQSIESHNRRVRAAATAPKGKV